MGKCVSDGGSVGEDCSDCVLYPPYTRIDFLGFIVRRDYRLVRRQKRHWRFPDPVLLVQGGAFFGMLRRGGAGMGAGDGPQARSFNAG